VGTISAVSNTGNTLGKFLLQSICILSAMAVAGHPALADDYAEARANLVAAYQAKDHAAMVAAAEEALAARPGYPGALFNLALANSLHGDPQAALGNLTVLLNNGIDFGVADMAEFAELRELPGWESYLQRVAALHEPVGSALVAAQLDEDRFVPEGIAIDAHGAIWLGSIHRGLVLRDGEVVSDRQGHWSVFGMRFHADGSLWFASAAVAQLADVEDDLGKTGLFRLDPETGKVTRAALLPQFEERQVLGDLIIAGDTIYTSDSLTGAVYRYDIGRDDYSAIVERGALVSPQGLVLDATGKFLFVADYVGGLYRVSLGDGELERMMVVPLGTDFGIDGLYRHGDDLVAIQNGNRPHRVATFRLLNGGEGAIHDRVVAANLPQFDEPTLGVVQGDDFYFVANSHWNRFDPDNALPEGLSGPTILVVSLIEREAISSENQSE
jgi:sugar lactone lactonase YvrE